jgi:hypothetical protein
VTKQNIVTLSHCHVVTEESRQEAEADEVTEQKQTSFRLFFHSFHNFETQPEKN